MPLPCITARFTAWRLARYQEQVYLSLLLAISMIGGHVTEAGEQNPTEQEGIDDDAGGGKKLSVTRRHR
jgi:hypothetical protein